LTDWLSTTAAEGLASGTLAVEHQFDIVDGLKQKAPRKFTKPAIDGSPMTKMHRKHPPPAARAHQVAHRINDLAEFDLARPPAPTRLRHQRRDPLPLLVRQIRRITLRLPGNLGHPAPGLTCPHRELERMARPVCKGDFVWLWSVCINVSGLGASPAKMEIRAARSS
jgi:hypothetical protein